MKIPDGAEVVVLLYLVSTAFLCILGDYASRIVGIWQAGMLVTGALVFMFWTSYTVRFMGPRH